jgi:hypothetical protein
LMPANASATERTNLSIMRAPLPDVPELI